MVFPEFLNMKTLSEGLKPSNEFFDYIFHKKEMIWMGQNTNHLNHDERIINAIIDSILNHEYCKYPPPEGFKELKRLVLEDLKLNNDEFDNLITAGGTESLYITMQTLLDSEDEIITSDPGYLIIDNFARRFGRVISVSIYNEDCNYKLTPDLVNENITKNTKLISLIDPLNPLGSCYTKSEIKAFAEIAEEYDIYLLHDITYRDFAEKHYLVAKYAPERSFTVYSFSKICGLAGLRVGSLIVPAEFMESVRSSIINDLGTNVLAQRGAIAALKHKNKWVDKVKRRTRKNQKIIKDAVDEIDGAFIPVYPSNANMLVVDIHKTGVRPSDIANYLLKHNIFIREGTYTSRLHGEKYVRVSFSIPKEQVMKFAEKFVSGMKKLSSRSSR
ncbi:aminotransferase class I and II [Methanothermus fervidus DSM 2088]|uniref:Aminotransferase n=1 Tax=Methanothermus fervidus (strain ATCC 43054 / DSM 2088 / JCM 10308 / V24 S) TaxID=523846 RepID=E3GZI8_METFV|nr:aminotransferase class I and II [Methanothermus fervidus DSM 2088]